MKLSIVIPCYNQGEYLIDALSTINSLNKAYVEVIIINDGSTEERTNNIIEDISKDDYIIISQLNQGLAKSRNKGINIAKGEYILTLDADNIITPEYLNEALTILENEKNVGVVYSNPIFFGKRTGERKLCGFDHEKIAHRNYIDACAFFRKSLWKEIGGFDENMPIMGYEDWDFWIRVSYTKWDFYHINKPLFYYRVRNNSMLSEIQKNENQSEIISYLYQKHSLFFREAYLKLCRRSEFLLQYNLNSNWRIIKFFLKVYSYMNKIYKSRN